MSKILNYLINMNISQKVQVDMDNLCANIHNFYDDLENQKNVFLYHGAALKIAQSSTPTFVSCTLCIYTFASK